MQTGLQWPAKKGHTIAKKEVARSLKLVIIRVLLARSRTKDGAFKLVNTRLDYYNSQNLSNEASFIRDQSPCLLVQYKRTGGLRQGPIQKAMKLHKVKDDRRNAWGLTRA